MIKEAQKYASENNLLFLESSAKTGQNVEEAFRLLANKMPRTTIGNGGGKLNLKQEDEKSGCKC